MDDAPAPSEPAGGGQQLPWDPFRAAVLGLAIDRATAEVVVALRQANMRSIVLKGRSFAVLLYDSGEQRLYGDVDLLIPARDERRAGEALHRLGYQLRSDREPEGTVDHASVWVRPSDGLHVDLHRTLSGIQGGGADPWKVLAADTDSMLLGGTNVEILSEPARALHVALHAALPGRGKEKTLIDLSRALERLPHATWAGAAALARRLNAQAAFAAGLGRLPAGVELAGTLELARERSVEEALLADSAPPSAWTVERLSKATGVRARLAILVPRLFPKPEFMRVWYPVARRGRVGLVLAYLQRVIWLVMTAPRAVRQWRRARRESQGSV